MKKNTTIVEVKSDATNKELTEDTAYQVGVVFNNTTYVIDIDSENIADELENITVADAIRRGEKVDSFKRNSQRSLVAGFNTIVRQWAKDNDIEVNDRGAVPNEIIAQYREYCEKEGISTDPHGVRDLV